MKQVSYLELAFTIAGIRKQISEEIEMPGDLILQVKAQPDKTIVTVSFKHARKGTKVGGTFELSELHRQMTTGDFAGVEAISSQIFKAMPELKTHENKT